MAKPKGPKKPRPPKGYRALALAGALFLGGCADGFDAEEAVTCAVLGGLLTEQLVNVGCGPDDLGLLFNFSLACGGGTPDRTEARACYDAALDLESCPRELPAECGAFSVPE